MRDLLHRRQTVDEPREQVTQNRPLLGQRTNLHRRLGDDPEPALAAEHHLTDARPCRHRRVRTHHQDPGGSDDPQALGQIGDIPISVGLHPRGARRDPAAERGVGERVGNMPKRESVGSQLVLQSRAGNAGLHASQARCPIDLEHGVQARQVDRDGGPRLGWFRFQRPRDRRPSPERDHHRVVGDRRGQDGDDLRLAGWAHHDIRESRQITPSLADQVPQRLAAPVHHSVKRVGRDVLGPEVRFQVLAQRRRQDWVRDPQRREARGGRRDATNVEPELHLNERRQVGLVGVRELRAFGPPPPPLHLSHTNPASDRPRRRVTCHPSPPPPYRRPRRPPAQCTGRQRCTCTSKANVNGPSPRSDGDRHSASEQQSERKRPLAGRGDGGCRSRTGRGTTRSPSGPPRQQRCRFWNGCPGAAAPKARGI